MRLELPERNLAPFLACLGIGTLYAIRAGTISADVGIWSLAAPRVWTPLLNKDTVPKEIIDVLRTCDELSALQEALSDEPGKFDAEITSLIERLGSELRSVPDTAWSISWLPTSELSSWDIAELLNRPGPLWLMGANLSGANLSEANLQAANLSEANLTAAVLARADLSGANLIGADLTGADLCEANLTGARLLGSLRGANLRGANLRDANLRGANLEGAGLSEADLSYAYLKGATLRWADLSKANLDGTDLRDANLLEASTDGVDLEAADLRGAILPDGTKVE